MWTGESDEVDDLVSETRRPPPWTRVSVNGDGGHAERMAMAGVRAMFSSVAAPLRHRRFRCEVCHYMSSSRWHLKRHQLIHTGEKPFKCHLCPMTFALKHNMATHMRTHTGERPFQCAICPRTFTQQQGLKKHALKHTSAFEYYASL